MYYHSRCEPRLSHGISKSENETGQGNKNWDQENKIQLANLHVHYKDMSHIPTKCEIDLKLYKV